MSYFWKTENVQAVVDCENNRLIPHLQQLGWGNPVGIFDSKDGFIKVPLDPKLLGSYDATAGSSSTAGSATTGHATYSWGCRFTPAGSAYGNALSTIINIAKMDKDVAMIVTGIEVDYNSELLTHIKITPQGSETVYLCIEELYCSRSDIDLEGYRGLGFFPQVIPVLPETSIQFEGVFRTNSTQKQKFALRGYNYVRFTEGKNATGAEYS